MLDRLLKSIKELFEVAESLIGPNGCPWDKKQTLQTLRDNMIEEYSEYLDALENNDKEHIIEELGDVFFQACFLLLVGQKEGVFEAHEPVKGISEKLVRRHPHVFGDVKIKTEEELLNQWNAIKQKEKKLSKPQNPLKRIPKSLPPMQRGRELASITKKQKIELPKPSKDDMEEVLGYEMFKHLHTCTLNKISPEGALRKYMKKLEVEIESDLKEKALS